MTDCTAAVPPTDIAIIGMSCRFPGADDTESYWHNLALGVESVAIAQAPLPSASPVPSARWVYASSAVSGAEWFDAEFFGYTPKEAELMDPQQRLFMECAWEALENAGQPPDQCAGQVGVYAGAGMNTYLINNVHPSRGFPPGCTFLASAEELQVLLGSERDFLPTRLSYKLNLKGPSVNVQTACSTALVAVHLACQGLLNGECDMALAGAATVLTPQGAGYFHQPDMIWSSDGHCRAFDARADGTVFGNGVGVVVLKLLGDALADGDPIHAVIKGSAVNNDGGLKAGFTAPSVEGQVRLIGEALAVAGVDAASIGYVEAHGTGTALGDPMEVAALTQVFRKHTQARQYCALGSVKSNLGHLGWAAGMAGLIKAVLALKHRQIPATLHFAEPNPKIDFASSPFYVNTDLADWENGAKPRRAGVSAFGMGGTNAHVILEEAPVAFPGAYPASPSGGQAQLFTLSARSGQALRQLASRHEAFLGGHLDLDLADVCHTANTGRSQFEQRAAFVAVSTGGLRQQLAAFAQTPPGDALAAEAHWPDKIAFLFTGQGSQYADMGRGLYDTQPVFRRTLERCDEILHPLLGESLVALLYPQTTDAELPQPNLLHPNKAPQQTEPVLAGGGASSLLDQTACAQPALFALEYALAELWQSWGIRPDAVLGHSVGEYVAACVAGVFSLEEGLKLIAARGRLMGALPAGGTMAAVLADYDTVAAAIQAHADISIAAVNAPGNVVVSGGREALESISADLARQGIETRPLRVSHAFHSALMEPMLAEFGRIVRQVSFSPPKISLISNLTGKPAGTEIATPDYWLRHIRQPVQFQAGIETLASDGVGAWVEIGPKPTLLGLARQCLEADPKLSDTALWLPSLRPGQNDRQAMLASLGELYVRGLPINWAGVEPMQRRRLNLPTYPFQRQHHWIEPPDGKPPSLSSSHANLKPLHPLLRQRIQLAGSQEIRFETLIDPRQIDWVRDHSVFGTAILPGTAYVEMALAAALALKTGRVRLEQLRLHHALRFPENRPQTVQIVLVPTGEGNHAFHIYSLAAANTDQTADVTWVIHADGTVAAATQPAPPVDLPALQAQCTEAVSAAALYQCYQDQGMAYGPSYRILQTIWRQGETVLGEMAVPANLAGEVSAYQLHPVLLDAGMQLLEALTGEGHGQTTLVPVGLDNLEVHAQPGITLWAYARMHPADGSTQLTADIQLVAPNGQAVATIRNLRMRRVGRQAMLGERKEPWRDWLYETVWQTRPQFGLPANYLPPPTTLQAQWSGEFLGILAQMPEMAAYGTAFDQLEAVSLGYVVAALTRLGACWQLGSQWQCEDLAAEFGIVPQYQRLFRRMFGILAEEGILRDCGGIWEVIRKRDNLPQGSHGAAGSLAQAELALLTRCGEKLASVLRGGQDPLDLLFPGGDASLLNQLYQNSLMGRPMHQLVQQVVSAAIARLPANRGLRVLEVGAGTGSTTAYLLPILPADRTEYVFTDISSSLLRQAQTRFHEHGFVRYQTLNIEKEPAAQGFALHQCDLVIAANVLHATQDLRQTLAHVRQLLAPGGWLVLLEETTPTRWVDLTFGLTDGWWRFEDVDIRPTHPLASVRHWQTLLHECGFAAASTLDEGLAVKGSLGQVVITAQADAAITPQARVWLVLSDALGMGEAFAAQLEQRGETPVLVFADAQYRQLAERRYTINPEAPADFQKVIQELPEIYGIVHLWSLDMPPGALTLSGLQATRMACGSLLHLMQNLFRKGGQPPALWLVTCDAQAVVAGDKVAGVVQSPLWGMGKVIALEHPELRSVCIDLDSRVPHAMQADALATEVTGSCHASRPREDYLAFRQGGCFGARLVHHSTGTDNLPDRPFRLEIGEPGLLDSLQLRPLARRQPEADEVEIRVYATGMNFRDVLSALFGLFMEDVGSLGTECAGVVVAVGDHVKGLQVGDAVIAMAAGCFSQYLTVKAERVYDKPPSLSFAEAAGIGDAFSTAEYCLRAVAQIGPGDHVLIHAAAGGVGLAAVQLAQRAGAKVFATASPGKWAALKSYGIRHVYNSRTLDFAEQILADTDGRGVDIVLNSLTGEGYIEKNLAVLAKGGRFIEISKRDVWDIVQMAAVRPDVEYSLVDLDEMAKQQPERMRSLMLGLLDQFNCGQLNPLPHTEFPMHDIVNAFRTMQQAKHIGKIIVTQPVESKLAIRSDGVYLITGGLGGLGLRMSHWLAKQGARHLLLVGRGKPSLAARADIAKLEQIGVEVTLVQADISDVGQIERVLASLHPSCPLRGVIHAAGVLDDGSLLNQNWERFARVLAPKVLGAWHLHTLTRDQPLDFFVMFSSVTGVLGNRGQANHAAANAFLDALAHHRRTRHLPALSIAWGAWSEIGAAAGFQAHLQSQGMGMIAPEQGVEAFAHLLRQELAQASVSPMEWPQFCLQFGERAIPAFLRGLVRQPSSEVPQEERTSLRGELETATPRQRRDRLLRCVQEEVARVIGLRQMPSPQQGFFDLGVDSLMTIEVRNRLQTRMEMALASTLLFTHPTIQDLTDFLANQFALPELGDATHGSEKAPLELPMQDEIEQLSPDELELLIGSELEQLNTLLSH